MLTAVTTIAEQSATTTAGFAEQVGPDVAAVFTAEQAALRDAGLPGDAVSVGDVLPDAPLLSADGAGTSLAAVLAGAPAVLVFYRGAWCPYCNVTLAHYQAELLPALSGRGVGLVAISSQAPDGSAAMTQSHSLGYPAVSDPGASLIRALGLATEPSPEARAAHRGLGFDVADHGADGTATLAHPAVLVVGGDRRVSFADVHVDYTSRTEVGAVLTAVDDSVVASTT